MTIMIKKSTIGPEKDKKNQQQKKNQIPERKSTFKLSPKKG